MAIFLNKLFTLCPAFADVSINIILRSWAFAVASSSVTCLRHLSEHSLKCSLEEYAPFVRQIGLVPDKHDHDVVSSLRPHVLYPFRRGKKRLTVYEQLRPIMNDTDRQHALVISNTTIATVESRM